CAAAAAAAGTVLPQRDAPGRPGTCGAPAALASPPRSAAGHANPARSVPPRRTRCLCSSADSPTPTSGTLIDAHDLPLLPDSLRAATLSQRGGQAPLLRPVSTYPPPNASSPT